MGKTLTRAQSAEYDLLESFLKVLCDVVLPKDLPALVNPLVVLEGYRRQSPMGALRRLREAVHDMVEATENMSDDEVTALEQRLVDAGAPSLQSIRERRARAIFAILERGSIQSEDEWRLVSGELSGVESRLLSGSAREIASELLGRYELAKAR